MTKPYTEYENSLVKQVLSGSSIQMRLTTYLIGIPRYYANNVRISADCYHYLDILCKAQSCFHSCQDRKVYTTKHHHKYVRIEL